MTSRAAMAMLWLLAGVAAIAAWLWIPVALHPDLDAAQVAQVPDALSRIQVRQAQDALRDGVRTSLFQGFAAILVVVGALAAWRQVKVGREGHITGQLSHAIDQIGSDNPDVQIGGVYTLERIARHSREDRLSIMFLLGAFVRRRVPWTHEGFTDSVDMTLPWLRVREPVVQTAMNVLSRRSVDPMSARLHLARTDLRSLALNDGGLLTNANLNRANLARAWLPGVVLDHASLKRADLRHANLQKASLKRADLRGANLSGANLDSADLSGVITDDSTVWPASVKG